MGKKKNRGNAIRAHQTEISTNIEELNFTLTPFREVWNQTTRKGEDVLNFAGKEVGGGLIPVKAMKKEDVTKKGKSSRYPRKGRLKRKKEFVPRGRRKRKGPP